MWKKIVLKDALGAWILLSGCLAAGIILKRNAHETSSLGLFRARRAA